MFIVLEGSDGSGKTTQFKLLAERLRAAGHEVDIYEFPRYNEPSSYFIQRYLNGEYGPASEISPYTASLFYALDRFEAAPLIRQSLSENKIVLADRYAGSNMAHQGAKFTRSGEQRGFFVWEESLEFQLLSIPRPTINLFLRVPAETSYELIKKRAKRSYTDKSHDEHEADIGHLQKTVSAYDNLCQLFPKDFKIIDCTQNGRLLPITEINNRIWDEIKPLLPKPSNPGRPAVVSLDEKTNTAAKPELVNLIRPPLKRTDFIDENFEIKDISLLALNSFREQGLTIEYQLKWPPQGSKTRLNYYIPAGFSPKLAEKYRSTMDRLTDFSRRMNKSLPESAKQYLVAIVPMAALVDAKISGNREIFNHLLSKPAAREFIELRQITKQTRANLKEPQALRQIIRQMADTGLGSNSATVEQPVKLLSASPRNELDLLPDCLYPYSNLGRNEIAAEIERWTYEQKAKALTTLCSSDPDSVLKKVAYRFDVIDDTLILESLVKLLNPAEIQIQFPTPRYGYRVPEEIEKEALDEQFIECFDRSLELFSDIQAAGQEHLASYAVLLGHRQRWQLSLSGESIFGQYPEKPGNTALKELRDQITETHPLISKSASVRSPNAPPSSQKITVSPKTSGTKRRRKKRGSRSNR